MTFVLCFSPLGSMLRETLHEYGWTCCTVDWYEEWPMEALEAMAHRLLDGVSLDLQSNEGQKLARSRKQSNEAYETKTKKASWKYLRFFEQNGWQNIFAAYKSHEISCGT